MTREEREKAINALKISTPIMAMRQERLNDYIQTLNKIIDWLEQEPRWIPVSEGLPKEGEKLIDDDVFVFCEDGKIRIGFCSGADLNGNREWYVADKYSKVIAWMPLPWPEPYKAESEK